MKMRKKQRRSKSGDKGLVARLVVEKDGAAFLGQTRVSLLEKIEETGSINRAAKEIGVSYKAAWDSIDAMNNVADDPLVVRSTGGKNGGGTSVTENGKRFIRAFRTIEDEYQKSLEAVNGVDRDFIEAQRTLQRFAMTTSARNQFAGTVVRVLNGAVNAEVEIKIDSRHKITAIIPLNSVMDLGIKKGSLVHAIFTASSVMLSTDVGLKISARNQLGGTISRLEKGAVNSEISLDLGDGKTVCATISNSSVEELGLTVGIKSRALVKSSDVLVAVVR
jgi:molybdate transport system regulatory protein